VLRIAVHRATQGIVVLLLVSVIAGVVVLSSLLVDLAYTWLDPRIRLA
jgi:ABC-type dipeptide/oligopeptide/nickel transport system permease component